MTMRIWIDRDLPDGLDIPSGVELVSTPEKADAVIVGSQQPWDGAACKRYPNLKAVVRAGIGYDNVDVDQCATHGVAACNAPDAPTVSTAEHALALLLAVTKRLGVGARRLRAHEGDYIARNEAIELDGLTIGLVGSGRIGGLMARYCAALGMEVLVHDPFLDEVPVGTLVDLDELWARSDVISLHAPATDATRHLVNTESIAAMKPGVVIINCARGALVDHDALLAALDSGRVAGAGLDVTEPEPLPEGHPLLDRDDVVVTPHVASSTTVGKLRLYSHAFDQAVAWLSGEQPRHLLNPAVLDPGVDRRRKSD